MYQQKVCSFLLLNNIQFMDVLEFNHSSVEWLNNILAILSCFQLWGIANKAALNVHVQVFV